ncbi:MAG TPA: sulfurtransferase TusA family protein [Kiloniellales bacterium]|nr:sulfurtransferase TusA family protein [Kiloniellales bacterium]
MTQDEPQDGGATTPGATFLDARGLRCPLPVLRARKAMKGVDPGALLEVHATDPSAVQDFKAFCETTGDTLVDSREADGLYVFVIRKRG